MDTEVDQQSGEQKEATILNVICALAWSGFGVCGLQRCFQWLLFTTDNLFLIVVCLLLPLSLRSIRLSWLVQTGRITLPFTKTPPLQLRGRRKEWRRSRWFTSPAPINSLVLSGVGCSS